jgi:predicted nucleic acid-binding protein
VVVPAGEWFRVSPSRRTVEPAPSTDSVREVINQLCRLPVVTTDADPVRRAITTSRRWQLVVWDALIVEAARSSGCDRILTEDLQDRQDLDGVTAENPS